jgi:signal transduction histidine kinase
MSKLALLLFLSCPMVLAAQSDTVFVGKGTGNLLSDRSGFGYQPVTLYNYNWIEMSHLPTESWQIRRNADLIFPANTKAVALRFCIKNTAEKAQELILEIDDAQLDRAKIWIQKPDKQVGSSRMSGDKMPFFSRDIAFANPNFKINVSEGEIVAVLVYLDQSGLFLRPRLRLWTIDDFADYAARRQLLAGLILGVFGISTLVFSLVALFRILPAAKWYAGFLCLQTLQIATQLGLGHQFFWPGSGLWSTVLSLVLPLAAFFLLFKLLDVLLDVKNRLPYLHRLLRNGTYLLIGFTIIAYLIHLSGEQNLLLLLYPLGMLMAIGLSAISVVACLRIWQQFRDINSLLFLLAFSCGIAGAIVSWLTKMGFPINFNAGRYGIVIGFCFDLLIFNYLISRNLWQTKTNNQALQLALSKASLEATANLLRGQEEERKRLSMDLHDGVGIELGSIRRRLETLFESPGSQANAEARQTVGDLANVAEQIRKFSHALDPFSAKNLSLPDLLDNLLFDFENNSPDVSVNLTKTNIQYRDRQSITSLWENEKHLFFIAAELLNNIARHARSTKLDMKIEYFPDKIILEIGDNGIGYDPKTTSPGVGLSHIHSRVQLSGAFFQTFRQPGKGMLHRVEMPFQVEHQGNNHTFQTIKF